MSVDNRTSNALGVPIPVWIVKQLDKRSRELSVENGASNNNLLFRANRSSWVRMVSSVDIREKKDNPNRKDFIRGKANSTLAKEYVLQAGISKYASRPDGTFSYVLRNGFKDVYNPLNYGVDKYGYRPMPGITSVKISTQGRLGSIRSAEIQLKAWTKDQLDVIDTLYFKLGFTMFLEWGHTYYYDHNDPTSELKSSEELSLNPFEQGLTKEDIYSRISTNVQKSGGNYDGMLGMVTNFNFTYNQEGGYDCTIRLIALGGLMSQIKINNPKELPEILSQTVADLTSTLLQVAEQQKQAELAKAQAELQVAGGNANAAELAAYPACIRNRQGADVTDTGAGVNGKVPNKPKGVRLTTKNQINYFFYPGPTDKSGTCETTGLTGFVLPYQCDGENIVVNGISEAENTATYEQFLKQPKNTKRTTVYTGFQDAITQIVSVDLLINNSLNKNYSFIVNIASDNKDYIAINKFKNFVPINTDLQGLKVTSKIQLPSFDKIISTSGGSSITFPSTGTGTYSTISVGPSAPFTSQTEQIASVSLLVGDLSAVVNIPKPTSFNLIASSVQSTANFGTYTAGGNATPDIFVLDGSYFYSFIEYYKTLSLNVIQERSDYTTMLLFDQFPKTNDGVKANITKKVLDSKNITTTVLDSKVKDKLIETLNNQDLTWTISKITSFGIDHGLDKYGFNKQTDKVPLRIILKTNVSITLPVSRVKKGGTSASTGVVTKDTTISADENCNFDIYIVTSDIGLLKTLSVQKLPFTVTDSVAEQQVAQNTGTTPPEPPPPPIDVNEVQKAEAARYRSAFEIMVRTIQLYSLNNALELETKTVTKLRLLEKNTRKNLTSRLFQTGLFGQPNNDSKIRLNRITNVLYGGKYEKKLPDGNIKNLSLAQLCDEYDAAIAAGAPITEDLMIVRFIFGFHFGLLGGKTTAKELFDKQLYVDYDSLMTSYVVPYEFSESIFQGATVNHPVYIPLGLVIMMLNHMCTIYDKDRPIIYIDFNHKTNICLSTPQHLSTNPYEVLIPFQGSNEDFKMLLDPATVKGNDIKAQKAIETKTKDEEDAKDEAALENPTPTAIYTPAGPGQVKDLISGGLLTFKQSGEDKKDSYRGRTLNILVSCDYILESVTRFAKNNGSGDVYLKEFLEDILFNINKSLGDVNVFRVAYDDSGNAIHIVDDQSTPNLEDKYPEPERPIGAQGYTSRLPLFGKGTVARSLEIKTEISSKLSNMIAISSNAKQDQSSLSKSTQQFGIYSENYVDRYANAKTEYSASAVESPTNTQIKSAIQFNNAIRSFYGDAIPAKDSVAGATGYYIERMSKIKGESSASIAASMIPVSLNFSMDGMSGFGMGQSFTVDPDFLPYSYSLPDIGDPRTVAFVMTGLDHTIEGNQWTSDVRTNMIYGKKGADFEKDKIRKLSTPDAALRRATAAGGVGSQGSTSSTSFVASNEQAKAAAEAYLEGTLTDAAWSELVSATFAEASRDREEEAAVMAVILNRVRTNFGKHGSTVYGQLRARNQFESVTGADTTNFIKGPDSKAATGIYTAAVNFLKLVPKSYLFFTAADRSLFYDKNGKKIKGRDSSNYDNAVLNYKLIGKSYFG